MRRKPVTLCRPAGPSQFQAARWAEVTEPGGIAGGPTVAGHEISAGEVTELTIATRDGVRSFQQTDVTFTARNLSIWPLAEGQRVLCLYQRLQRWPIFAFNYPIDHQPWIESHWVAVADWDDGLPHLSARTTTTTEIAPGGSWIPWETIDGRLAAYMTMAPAGPVEPAELGTPGVVKIGTPQLDELGDPVVDGAGHVIFESVLPRYYLARGLLYCTITAQHAGLSDAAIAANEDLPPEEQIEPTDEWLTINLGAGQLFPHHLVLPVPKSDPAGDVPRPRTLSITDPGFWLPDSPPSYPTGEAYVGELRAVAGPGSPKAANNKIEVLYVAWTWLPAWRAWSGSVGTV